MSNWSQHSQTVGQAILGITASNRTLHCFNHQLPFSFVLLAFTYCDSTSLPTQRMLVQTAKLWDEQYGCERYEPYYTSSRTTKTFRASISFLFPCVALYLIISHTRLISLIFLLANNDCVQFYLGFQIMDNSSAPRDPRTSCVSGGLSVVSIPPRNVIA